MNILIIEAGPLDCMMNLMAGLIKNNHKLFILHSNIKKMPPVFQKIDLVITQSWIGVDPGGMTVFDALKCPIINISLGNSIRELLGFKNFDAVNYNNMCKSKNIFNWIMCRHMEQEFRDLGLVNSFYAPWGTSQEKAIPLHRDPERIVYPNEIALLTADQYVAAQRKSLTTASQPNPVKRDVKKMLFMGVSPNDLSIINSEDSTLSHISMNKLDEITEEYENGIINGMSRIEFANRLGIFEEIFSQGITRESLHKYDQLYLLYRHTMLKLRKYYVKLLYEQFGDTFVIYGDGWEQEGVKAFPTSALGRNVLYADFPVTLDFGSLSYETAIYPRPMQVVSNGGYVFQFRNSLNMETDDQQVEDSFFNTPDEMMTKMNKLLNDPLFYLSVKMKQTRYFSRKYDFSTIFEDMFTTINHTQ